MITKGFGPATGKPVLLLHGGGVAGWMWTSLRRSLETRHRVLVPELPGHGESSSEPYVSHAATIEALAQLLVAGNTGPVAVACNATELGPGECMGYPGEQAHDFEALEKGTFAVFLVEAR